MGAAPGLLRHRLLHRRVGMAKEHGARPQHVVDILVARGIPEARPLAVADHEADVLRQRVAAQRAAGQGMGGHDELVAFHRRHIAVAADGAGGH